MIPRLKPHLGIEELLTLIRHEPGAVAGFEKAFASVFQVGNALAFPYGRSALWSFFKAQSITNAEIILPAYTCSVVAHAIVLSGNRPRFVDIRLHDYTMELDQVAAAINEHTRAVIATHLWGYPLDVDRLNEIVRAAEHRYGHTIWIVQDCAHSFAAHWHGKSVVQQRDIALFGLNISKMITSVFGGMLTTNNPELAQRVRAWRDAHFARPNLTKALLRRLYLLATYPAFNEHLYSLVHWLQEATPLLNRATKAYHLDEKIHFPPDYLDQMLAVEAQVGLEQLRKYPQIVQQRREHTHFYTEQLQGVDSWVLPPLVEGATYSHYVIRVPDRDRVLAEAQHAGVQLGQLIEYSLPHMTVYATYAQGQEFPNSLLCSQQTINLPVYASLTAQQRAHIVAVLREVGPSANSVVGTPGRKYNEYRHPMQR
jgi:perosamine synthetase